jgi:hypothetical protein
MPIIARTGLWSDMIFSARLYIISSTISVARASGVLCRECGVVGETASGGPVLGAVSAISCSAVACMADATGVSGSSVETSSNNAAIPRVLVSFRGISGTKEVGSTPALLELMMKLRRLRGSRAGAGTLRVDSTDTSEERIAGAGALRVDSTDDSEVRIAEDILWMILSISS